MCTEILHRCMRYVPLERIAKGVALFAFGSALFVLSAGEQAFAQSELPELSMSDLRMAADLFVRLVEGIFGSLVMTGSAFMAVVTAAIGGYRMSVRMLTVAVAALIVRSVVAVLAGPL